MRSYITSYNGLLTYRAPDAPAIDRIEIPLFQRDYAQGRNGGKVERIRMNFLKVLQSAVTGGSPVNLDFVYGEVVDGTFRPLDGQQRLTTLFLLHWYLAFRTERISQEHGWKRFSYAIRASARLFCERLSNCQPPVAELDPSAWIMDQSWYLHTWRHDPTIKSMLVMLDTMHELFQYEDCLAAWQRLIDAENPAISFHLLPIEEMGQQSADLYIKMNSRGKPLTDFENFKARFEQLLEDACPDRVMEFANNVDGKWADLLWSYRGGEFIVDDEFLRYFRFVTELCDWLDRGLAEGEIASLAERVYGPSNVRCLDHLDFLFRAFDTWVDFDIPSVFSGFLAASSAPIESRSMSQVVLFGQQDGIDVNLFSLCCQNYGETRGRNRVFSWPQTIILFAILLHRIYETEDFARRLRVLRNLVEASSNELRLENMPMLLDDVRRIVVEGTLENVSTFNQAQVIDERFKAEFLVRSPSLETAVFLLEDHPLLRGCLAAFELDEAVFERRAGAFRQLFVQEYLPSLTGALLAIGDYSIQLNHRMFQFGSGSNLGPWRELLTRSSRLQLAETREMLGVLLDEVALAAGNPQATLDEIQRKWLNDTVNANGLGWRWYFLKYPVMRQGQSGIYVGSNGVLAYNICMLNKTRMTSWYRDPFLLAIYQESGGDDVLENPWFTGYETEARSLRLKKSGTEFQCLHDRLVLRPPSTLAHAEIFLQICAKHGVGADHDLIVPQVESHGCKLDICDRVHLSVGLLRNFVDAGL